MELKLNIDGQDLTIPELLPMYELAKLASELQSATTQAQNQANLIMEQMARIEPDPEKQKRAIEIVQFVLERFPR